MGFVKIDLDIITENMVMAMVTDTVTVTAMATATVTAMIKNKFREM